MRLHIGLLGVFEATRDAKLLSRETWGRRKTLALAKLLIAHRGAAFSYEQLIETLYEKPDSRQCVNNLYRRVSELRRALEPDLRDGRRSSFIGQQGQTYLFRKDAPCDVDIETFLNRIELGHRLHDSRQYPAAVKALQDAMSLYRGDFLEEDRYEEWTQRPRANYRESYLGALGVLAACHARLGEYEQSIEACRRVLDIQPYRESVIRQLMEYYAVSGDRSQAIAAYNNGIRSLADVLNVQPEAKTTQLFKQIAGRTGMTEQRRLDRRRIAVVPFVNLGEDPTNQVFVDGLTGEIIHMLSNVPQLWVVSQASAAKYTINQASLQKVGGELNVGSVLEGNVRIRDGEVRIVASFYDVQTEARLWSETFDGRLTDVLAIRTGITEGVTRALRQHLGDAAPDAPRESPATCWEAYERFLIGRYHWSQRTPDGYQRATRFFEESLRYDPNYSSAYAGLAAAWCDLGECGRDPDQRVLLGRKAEVAARRALELDPRCAEARATLGRNRMYFGHDPMGATRELRKAIQLNPSNAMACNWLGVALIGLARFDEAVEVLQTAHRHDPLSLAVIRNLGRAFYSARRYEEATGQLRKALDINAGFTGLHSILGLVDLELEKYDEAAAEFEEERLLDPRFAVSSGALISIAHARRGDITRLCAMASSHHAEASDSIGASDLIWVAAALLEAGYESQAIAQLNRALEISLGWFMLYIHSPLFDRVTSKPWYVALLKNADLVSA